MKVWVLFFFAAVWMQMPSESGARHAPALKALSPATKRSFSPAMLADVTKRHNAQVKRRGALSDEDSKDIREFLESDEVREFLEDIMGVTMKDIDELVDNDDDIPAENKDMMKAWLIMTVAGGSLSMDSLNDIEARSVLKQM